MLQGGFPAKAWDWSISYSSTALAITKPAPILPQERDAAGNVLEALEWKTKMTCWQAHHDGTPFSVPIQPFGRLCWYLDKSGHTLMPPTVAGLFVGWRLESGLRFRGVVLIANYDKVRKDGFQNRFVNSIPDKEVYFPPELVFPFAEAEGNRIAVDVYSRMSCCC